MNKTTEKPKGKGLLSQHPFWLGKYCLLNIIIFAIGSITIIYWDNPFKSVSFWWILSLIPLFLNRFRFIAGGSILLAAIALIYYWTEISWLYLLFLPAAIYIGHLTAVCIHNAVHNNFKPVWINPVIGELCALQQISAGFPVFRLVHNQHHAYSDDPIKDPHPPKGYSFWQFVDNSRALITNRLTAIYLENWGDSEKSRNTWKIQTGLLLCMRFAKTLFIFVLLGPKLFVLLFIPSYLSNVFLFAAFNYFTHIENKDGTTDILNLDSNLYYAICNRILFGVFYHKNHHLKPKLFNPMAMQAKN